MRHSWKKIALATLLSLSSFAITHWVYISTAPKGNNMGNREPIAFVKTVHDEVQRRPVTRTIWQLLERGEPVYPGEAVRTSSAGEVSLEFVGTHRHLDLEPDTLIVLSKSKDEISMELLDGGAFVAGQGTGDDTKLTLQSKDGKVDLSKAAASVSKGKVRVLDGEAKDGDPLSALKVISPKVGEVWYQSLTLPQAVPFQWEGVPPEAKVDVYLGPQRKSLKNFGAASGNFKRDLKPGRYFWKLVATDGQGKVLSESPLFKLEVQGLAAPAAISPAAKEVIVVRDSKTPVDFVWSNPQEANALSLEIAKDAQFKQMIGTESIAVPHAHFEKVLPPGKYFWRITAYYPDGKPTSPSLIRPFEVFFKPPKPVHLAWDHALAKKQFFVDELKLSLKWSADAPEEVHSYYVRVARTPAGLASGQITESADQQAVMKVTEPGHYVAAIEAVDKKGEVLSKTEPREFDLAPLPLLEAPSFDGEGDLHSTPRGDLRLTWKAIDGAKSYFVTVKDSTGTEVQAKSYTQNSTRLTSLMPGTYQAEVYALDGYGRKSNQGPPRKIVVPESSGLSAPKLKKVKVN